MTPEAFRNIEITLPGKPGVYRYVDAENNVLYVGKAKNLKKRVSSYFQKSDHSARIKLLIKKTARIEFTIVNSEQDAFLLENTLIKKHQPRYNVNLKDGKTYPYIVVKNERFPRIYFTRKKTADGSTYLGPFTSKGKVQSIFEFIKSIFPIRTCSYYLSEQNIRNRKFKVCLEYHLGNCKGPCEGLQSEEEYMENVQHIVHILKGNMAFVKNVFRKKIEDCSARLEFEKAEDFRKKLEIIEAYQGRSTVVDFRIDNVDVFGYVQGDRFAVIHYIKIMEGMVTQTRTLVLSQKLDETPEELLAIAVAELRMQLASEAREIILPFRIESDDAEITQTIPLAGDKKKLLDLATKNAAYIREEKDAGRAEREAKSRETRILDTLQADFRLTERPMHIECFDNSNMQGSNPVASMVVFKNAKPSKKDYRHFSIKTVTGPDDFSSMREIVFRRYKRLTEEAAPLPQLIVIDGGKGQLHAACDALKELNIYGKVAICSIAKRLEEIYFPDDPLPLYIDKRSESLRLVQHIRDEAHRFAITFHRQKRSKSAIHSQLTDIKGIGETTMRALMREFGSVKKLRAAGEEEIAKVTGPAKARIITAYFQKENAPG